SALGVSAPAEPEPQLTAEFGWTLTGPPAGSTAVTVSSSDVHATPKVRESACTDSDHPEHVYLTDFGLTKKSLSLTGFTTVGQFVGTLDYVAPEQISGKPVDARCDVYGFACVVFETLAGHPPFLRDDDMALLWAHQYDEPPPLTEDRPDLDPRVDPVFAQALAKSPDDRYPSCLAFVTALRAATTGGETDAPRTPTRVDRQLPGAGEERPKQPPRWAEPVFVQRM
ncbi:protein kinase, partial [Streptomyces sp. NPDC002130]|uniref:protein kinase domain-containing protein n=1 Tax=Streptomyces sp. NPDC002130 TaxID=3155568 RepID=UPI003331B307